ncbi:MAG: ABC transporter substrate-binding protein, partial [Andreesenia angusta]|nr:ABC transporter substrate-binding protein [Andreesenia angusta]
DEKSKEKTENKIFTDSVGRENEITNAEKIVPSGKLAQLMISMVAPEKLVSLAGEASDVQKGIPEGLPITGQLYGGDGQMNYEEIINMKPDLIIDIGEEKDNIKEDLDKVQDTTKIPTIFINASLENTAEAFRTLGKLLGNEKRGEELAEFTEDAISFAKSGSVKIKQKKRVYQTTSEDGLGADLDGTAHTEILNLIGAENAANIEAQGGKPGQPVSMEQVLEWNPDIIIANNIGLAEKLLNDENWQGIEAVKNKTVYNAPQDPFSWISKPPSANRIIGIYWMATMVYPEVYEVDLKEKTKEWYKLAYDYELNDEEYEKLLEGISIDK